MRLYLSVVVLAMVFIAGIIPGGMVEFYQRYPNYDSILHFLGGFVVAWFLSHVFARESESRTRYALFLVSLTVFVGVVWEFAEFLSGMYLKDIAPVIYLYFHGGDLGDTLLDLVLDIAGGGLFAAGSGLFELKTLRRVAEPVAAEADPTSVSES